MDPTTGLGYWLRWEVAMCCLSVLACSGFSAYLLWRYEGPSSHREPEADAGEAGQGRRGGAVYDEDSWRLYLHKMHPGWLLAYRSFAFLLFVVLTVIIISSRGNTILFYYTEWTFLLVMIYFGLATALSIYGCLKFADSNGNDGEDTRKKAAGFCGYVLQIIYQTSAGAVMLTDVVYWCIIFPVLVKRPNGVDFLGVVMHSLNAIVLLGDAVQNSLNFPWFRIAYFFIWTSLYVISQWIVHASLPIWWPYPFLDLSSRLAPLWYVVVGVLQIPCYLVFALLIKLKKNMYSRWFPEEPVADRDGEALGTEG